MSYSQTKRVLEIQTTLGTDLVMLTELEGEERISQPFEFNIRFVTKVEPASVAKLLGSAVSIQFGLPEVSSGLDRRRLHGHIRRLRRGMVSRDHEYEWHAEIVPMLWFLSRTSDCRIFQEKSIPDIVTEVLQLHGVTSVEKKLLGSYEPREYVVQYRESALDFVQRLMEQEGIFYWHEHSDGGHKLVLADDNTSTPLQRPPYSFLADGSNSSVTSFDEEIVVRSGKWTLRDFNFKTPADTLEATQPTTINVAEMKNRERFDYPGIYEASSAGGQVARHRIENEETFHLVCRGESGIANLVAGAQVTITDASKPKVLLTEVRHHAEDYSHWTDDAWDDDKRRRAGRGRRDRDDRPRDPFYANEFVCIPIDVKYRPERITPRPFVHGPQTAMVTGKAGEEIDTDEYGRVKVQFHWDRLGQKDDRTSCWIRVSQGWAGKNWGQIHIPRIGHEVIVDFLEGDPDRPIITGRVYNADHTVPYELPANKTQSGIKTRSSQGGGSDNFNEMRFEDKKGSEQIFVHAEKDLDTEVENNETRKVGLGAGTGNRTTEIKNDEKTTIKGNKTTDVTKNFKETITGTETRDVTGAVQETFKSTEKRTVLGTFTENVTGAYTITVAPGAYTLSAVGGINFTSPAPIMANSAAIINVVTPTVNQAAPSWFQTGAYTGTLYGFNMSNAVLAMANSGIAIANAGFNVTNSSMAITTFITSITLGALELKNKSCMAESYAFNLRRGFHLVSA